MLMPRRSLLFFVILPLFFASGCSGGKEPLPRHNPMGLPKDINQEAASAFALAHVLWRNSEVCSDPDLAIAYLDKAVALQADYADAYMRRGLAKSDRRDWDGAFDDVTRAIRIHPSAENYAYRGLISMRGGNALGARKDYNRSLEINSGQHRAWNFRAALNLLEDRREEACNDFRKGCSNGDCTGWESAKTNGFCK